MLDYGVAEGAVDLDVLVRCSRSGNAAHACHDDFLDLKMRHCCWKVYELESQAFDLNEPPKAIYNVLRVRRTVLRHKSEW